MNLAVIAWKSIRERGLASSLTALSVALGIMLMVSVLVIHGILDKMFNQRSINYDLIVGTGKGDPLQLVLSAVYHVRSSMGNVPYKYFLEVKEIPGVEKAIPITMGDFTEKGGFPIVGTIPDFFDIDYAPGRPFLLKDGSKPFRRPFDAYIGARVAQENGWTLGTKLKLVHGGMETGHVHDEEFEVVGLLAPTGTPHDKTVYVHLRGFYGIQGHDRPFNEAIKNERLFFGLPELTPEELNAEIARLKKKFPDHDHGHDHGHEHHGHVHDIPDVQKEVSAIFLQCKTPIVAALIAGEMKKGIKSQGVNPIEPMRQLMTDVLGPVRMLILVLTGLIVLVSGIGIFVSIYNSMSARRREIAIMRALGAQRGTVLSIIILESVMLCIGGGLLGLLLGHGLVLLAAPTVEVKTGLIVNPLSFSSMEFYLLPALCALGILVGILPGMTAYRTDVATSLSN